MKQNQLYNNVDYAIIPAGKDGKIYDGIKWEKARVVVTEKYLIYRGEENEGYIPLNNIYNLDQKLNISKEGSKNIINFFYKKKEEKFFGIIKSNRKELLKRSILVASISTIPVNYISPYQVEGRVDTKKDWNRGFLEITTNMVKIISGGDELVRKLHEEDIIFIESDKVKNHDAVKIIYEKKGKKMTDILYSPGVSLSILHNYFTYVLMGDEIKEISLSDTEKKMLIAIESGINSSKELSEMLEKGHEEILQSLEKLKKKGLMKEIGIEKIVDLTSTGKQKVSDFIER